jgi:transcription termination factor Rho
VWGVRRILHGIDNPERAMDMLIKGLKQTTSNQEFMVRMAKSTQGKNGIEV